MEITIEGESKEIAALVLAVQERREVIARGQAGIVHRRKPGRREMREK